MFGVNAPLTAWAASLSLHLYCLDKKRTGYRKVTGFLLCIYWKISYDMV